MSCSTILEKREKLCCKRHWKIGGKKPCRKNSGFLLIPHVGLVVNVQLVVPVVTRVVKADFLKAVREAVAQRLIKAVKRLLYVVNKTNDCFKMHLTSVRLWASTFHY